MAYVLLLMKIFVMCSKVSYGHRYVVHFNCTYKIQLKEDKMIRLKLSMGQFHAIEANNFSDTQELYYILWNVEVYYCIYCPPTVSIFRQINTDHAHPSHFLVIHFNITPYVVSFPQISPPKPIMPHSSPPFKLHDTPTSFVMI
jgi:hypothetical protein